MFQIASAIESVATRADGTYKMIIGTQELPPEQAAELFRFKGQLGWFLFSPNEIKIEDVPASEVAEFREMKTAGQRLRAVLWVYWKNCTNQKTPFRLFYEQWIEKKIDEIKTHLP